jgi:hypothetical protein
MKNSTSVLRRVSQNQLKRMKQTAKALKKKSVCTQGEALDQVARDNGFPNWKAVVRAAENDSRLSALTPQPSLEFVKDDEDNDAEAAYAEAQLYERSTDIPDHAKLLLAENRIFLAKRGIEYATFEPTVTGLKKSILDATQVVRTYFELAKFHSYDQQAQGIEHKILKQAFLLSSESKTLSRMSMYRPETKAGDPRMWFSGLGAFAPAGAQIAVVIYQDTPHLIDLTRDRLSHSIEVDDEVGLFLNAYCKASGTVAMELLSRLREVARRPLKALGAGDTAVGMAVEAALGIAANSSKTPDYNGIELKSGRGGKNRATLFAQVADWGRSPCSSSREILDRYGYERDGMDRLYCTINAKKPNSQGLYFKYDEHGDDLWEHHEDVARVAVWSGDTLRECLKKKHTETFWIKVTAEIIEGVEHFNLKSVVHTRAPLLNQLMPLIESGVVTMDHLIKRSVGAKPRVSEKGPLFKMNKSDLALLFPDPVEYSLI